jgi:hypothetical protein
MADKILIDRKDLEQVLEALQESWRTDKGDIAITALREALNAPLAQERSSDERPAQQQEPVAWMFQHGETGRTLCVDAQQVKWGFEERNPIYQKIAPLYTSPPTLSLAQRTWEEWFKWWRTSKVADCTEAEIDFADFMLIARAVESEYGIKENT